MWSLSTGALCHQRVPLGGKVLIRDALMALGFKSFFKSLDLNPRGATLRYRLHSIYSAMFSPLFFVLFYEDSVSLEGVTLGAQEL